MPLVRFIMLHYILTQTILFVFCVPELAVSMSLLFVSANLLFLIQFSVVMENVTSFHLNSNKANNDWKSASHTQIVLADIVTFITASLS